MDSITQADDGSLVSSHTNYCEASAMASNIVNAYNLYNPFITLEAIYWYPQCFYIIKLPAYIVYC